MPVTLTIIADNAALLVQEFRTLNAETTSSENPLAALASMPLDALIDTVRERLRDEGFRFEIVDQRDPNPPAIPPLTDPSAGQQTPPPSKNKGGRPRKLNGVEAPAATPPEVAADDDELPAPRKAASKPAPAAVEAEDPEGDRQIVLDTLADALKVPKLKDRVLAFAKKMAGQHGKDKISDLPAAPFPAIRRAMEQEFPGHAGTAA